MRQIPFNPKLLKGDQARWWKHWEARASQAREFLTATWKAERHHNPSQLPPLSFDHKVWGDLKNWFLEHVFFGHCAYCESPITRCDPDAEHYRPKGMVTHQIDQQTRVVEAVDETGSVEKHPGYFWLAYDWRNLLPSCHYCNRPNSSHKGKRNLFPVSKKHLFVISSRSR